MKPKKLALIGLIFAVCGIISTGVFLIIGYAVV